MSDFTFIFYCAHTKHKQIELLKKNKQIRIVGLCSLNKKLKEKKTYPIKLRMWK